MLLCRRALEVPVSDYTYNDCRLLSRVKQMRLARTANLLEVHKLRAKIGWVHIIILKCPFEAGQHPCPKR